MLFVKSTFVRVTVPPTLTSTGFGWYALSFWLEELNIGTVVPAAPVQPVFPVGLPTPVSLLIAAAVSH